MNHIISILKINQNCTHIYENSKVACGCLGVGVKGYSHPFSLGTSHSSEVCITVQEVAPPSHET